jgi:RHS repeat-associated protein
MKTAHRMRFDIGRAICAKLFCCAAIFVFIVTSAKNASAQIVLPASGYIKTIVGTGGTCGFAGDGGLATSARLCYPQGVAVDGSGNVYIADYGNHSIRKVTASTGVISTVAGIGGSGGYSGDGGQATSAQLALPMAVAIDSSGNMYIADYGNDLIRKVNSSGVISTFAGTYNSKGYTGDGGAATSAQLNNPIGVAVDASGNVYIVDSANNAIRKVTVSTGIISTYEGGPNASCYGNCPATNAVLNYPYDVAVDASGNVYTSEYWGGLIAEVTASTEIMNIVAGVGSLGYSGDDGPATSAHLNYPAGVAVDAHGNVYIVDSANLRIRKVTASTGVINTIAGNGTAGYTGDGGLATDAEINYSNGAAVDASGNFYFADVSDNVIRVLSGSATTPSIAVATSGTPSVYGTTVTFTATVTSGDTNQVTFYSGGTSLGTATPNSSGAATLTTSSLAVGSDAITASIAAGGNYGAATSSGITQMVDSAGSNWDAGTVTLTVYNSSNSAIFSQSASYGQGSTPNSVAEGLAGSNSNINATAVNDTLYVEAAGTGGANTDSYYYTVTQQSTAGFAPASFQGAPASGDLSGGANASGTQSVVYAYCIGTTTSYCSSPSPGYDPVGNVVNYSDINSSGGSVMGTWGYSYDSLNRLTSGQNAATTSTSQQYAGQNLCWVYDSFGNRTVQSQQSGTCPASSSSTPMWVYNANNQVSGVIPPGGSQASPSPYTYDQAGDVTQDYTTGNQYLYDAEGRICASQSRSGVGGWIMSGYVYDADGTRVAKGTITSWSCDPSVNGLATAGNETDYVLGPGGEQVTELAQDANGSMNWQRTYVDAAGALIATYGPVPNPAYNPSNPSAAPQTVYLPSFRFTDWLGTMRATTDSYGVAQGTCAGLPFGDSQACSGNIPDPHYLTGKERDAESGNDYFGARYYASTMGRFLSPDWSAKVEPVPYSKVDNPQTLNLYAYVLNNPLTRFDPDGHEVDLNGTDKQKAEEQSRLAANATRTDKNGLKESSLFKNVTDKSGKTTMVLDKAAAANWSGGHSQGFKDIVQTINNKDVVSVNLVNTDENQTRFDGNGHFTVNLATNQTALDRIAPLKNGNSLDIIAGHEILGHARMGMLGIPDWNRDGPGSPVFQYENNVLRPEYMQAHPNGPITGPRLDNEP